MTARVTERIAFVGCGPLNRTGGCNELRRDCNLSMVPPRIESDDTDPRRKPTPKAFLQIPFFCAFAPEDWIASSQVLLAKTGWGFRCPLPVIDGERTTKNLSPSLRGALAPKQSSLPASDARKKLLDRKSVV